jgi:hypothetical protein
MALSEVDIITSRDKAVGVATGYGLDGHRIWVRSQQGQENFLFTIRARLTLCVTQPLSQFVWGISVKLTNLVLMLRMWGDLLISRFHGVVLRRRNNTSLSSSPFASLVQHIGESRSLQVSYMSFRPGQLQVRVSQVDKHCASLDFV